MSNKEDTSKDNNAINSTIIVENTEIVSRYGSANAEFVKNYKGFDQETQRKFKGLNDISKSKVHPDYAEQNIKQQSGFSAEIHKVSRENSKNIIDKNHKRLIRTDDAPGFKNNDPKYDHVEIINGKIVPGSGSQMKFVENPHKLLNKIAMGEGGGKNDLSRYQGIPLDLPTEQVDAAKAYCRQKSQNLRQKAAYLEKKGELEKANKCRTQAKNFDELEKNCRDSGISTEDAIFLRKHPELATGLEILKNAHEAGVEGAKGGLTVGVSISAGLNIISLAKGEIEFDEAVKNVALDTCAAGAMGYASAAVGSVVKGAWQQSDIAIFRSMAKSSIPGMVTTITVDVAKTLARLGSGEIKLDEAIEELGQKGMNTLAGVWGGIVGQCAIPIPVVGAVVGSLIGGAISSLSFADCIGSIRGAKEAKERYEAIQARSRAACEKWENYRIQLETAFENHFREIEHECEAGLKMMEEDSSIEEFDIGANRLAKALNFTPTYASFNDFEEMLKSL